MSIKAQMNDDLKQAMKDKAVAKRDAIRNVLAAIRQVEVDTQKELDDEAILKVLASEAKRRRESIEAFEQGGRAEDAESERAELTMIEAYLPQQLSRAELEPIVAAAIASTGATTPQDMGKVMSAVMAQVKGQADGKLINQIVRDLLSQ